MKRYRDQQIVEPGWYFNPRHLAFRSIDERKPLGGRPGEDYIRVPILVTIAISPFLGLAYFMFLPLVGFVMLGKLLLEKAAVLVRNTAASTVRVLAPNWQPARAFLSRSRVASNRSGNHDSWAKRTARELGVEDRAPGRHVHISRCITIHSPFETTYTVAEDPGHWKDWFVGISEPRSVEGLRLLRRRPQISVGTHFPLIEAGCTDCREKGVAHWHSPGTRSLETGSLGQRGVMVLLPTEQDWEYRAHGDETEVRVDIDVAIPDEGWVRTLDAEMVKDLEVECIERSLGNLKALCETSTTH